MDEIKVEYDGPVTTIVLNRPEKLNAMTVAMTDALVAAFDQAEADDGVRVVIVTGTGRAFCAGTDLSSGFSLPTGGNARTGEGVPADVGGVVGLRVFRMRKPVLAAINGVSAGIGATLPLTMDRRFAVEGARFTFPFARRGIMVETVSSWFLPRIVGLPTALDWMLTGRMIEADEALAKGLVDELLPADRLLKRAREFAADIVKNTAPASVAVNRQLLWRMMGDYSPEQAHAFESRALTGLLAHPDSKEGVASFMEKRPPRFTGTIKDAGFMDDWWDEQ